MEDPNARFDRLLAAMVPPSERKKPSAGQASDAAQSVLCAYGLEDLDRLAASDIDGVLVPLRFPRFMVVAAPDSSWASVLRKWMAAQPGPVRISDAYRYIARHPKAQRNPNWKAKVRQKLPLVARRLRRDCYVAVSA